MQHADILNLAGLRIDGRKPSDLRKCAYKLGASSSGDGSCYLEQGLNKVLCVVTGPCEPTSRAASTDYGNDKGIVVVQLSNAPFSGIERKARRPGARRMLEIETMVRRSLEGVLLLELYARSQVSVAIHVLESDGSVVCTAINAACLALMDAGLSMSDMLVACSCGLVKQKLCLDLNGPEQNSGGAYLPVAVKASSKEIIYLQLDSRMSSDQLEEALAEALDGCDRLAEEMSSAIKQRMEERIATMGAM